MTSIQEITEIVQEEVFNGSGIFNRDQANEQLEIANSLTDDLIDSWKFLLQVPTLEAFNIILNFCHN